MKKIIGLFLMTIGFLTYSQSGFSQMLYGGINPAYNGGVAGVNSFNANVLGNTSGQINLFTNNPTANPFNRNANAINRQEQQNQKDIEDAKKKEEEDKQKTVTEKTKVPVQKTQTSQSAIGMTISGSANVLSGDTISINGNKIKLAELSVPGLHTSCKDGLVSWKCGERAKSSLEDYLGHYRVSCFIVNDQNGLLEGICAKGSENIGNYLIVNGLAVSESPKYTTLMQEARADHRGVWVSNDLSWRNQN